MSRVGCCYNYAVEIQGRSLCSRYHIAVQRGIGCPGASVLASSRPIRRRQPHGYGCDRQILDLLDQFVKAREARILARANQFASDFIVRNCRHNDRAPCMQKTAHPTNTSRCFRRSAGIGGQAERAAVQQYNPAHQLLPLSSGGKSL